jgi:hypothetical protein
VRKTSMLPLIVSLLAVPVGGASPYPTIDVRPGAFVGARIKLPLGERAMARAELAIAPTQSRISASGLVRTGIGEGVALSFDAKSKPFLTVAGSRADRALGLQPRGQADVGKRMGVSSAGWVAIGVGVVALAAGGYFLYLVHEADKNSD